MVLRNILSFSTKLDVVQRIFTSFPRQFGEHNIGYSVTIQDSMIDNQKLKE